MNRWLFDLGNTRLKCAPVDAAGRIGTVRALAHDGVRFDEGLAAALPARFTDACVASVASESLRAELLDALAQRCGRISLACTQRRFGDVAIAYAQPARLGVDRFLALLGARARGAEAALVVGVGTALTIDWLDADGRHRGGRIAPSPMLMREALHARAAHLPVDGGDYAEFADDTDDALDSGCTGAALALVERSLQVAQAQSGALPRLLLHGGGSDALRPRLPHAIDAPALVLEGLAQWAKAADAPA
ncbi:type III pantothenate kinase [Luteimonas mephitis]|uniref:type III pantothenate kinase n=1 Tax=Luteimonas mephitis TaxID=83615 RepID=UPI003A8EE1BA